jgi:hypothetical protein
MNTSMGGSLSSSGNHPVLVTGDIRRRGAMVESRARTRERQRERGIRERVRESGRERYRVRELERVIQSERERTHSEYVERNFFFRSKYLNIIYMYFES